MSKTNLKRTTIRGAIYAVIAASLYVLSAGGASAWGPATWAVPGQYAQCQAPYNEWQSACNGWTYGQNYSGVYLVQASAANGKVRARTSHGTQVTDHQGGDTTAISPWGNFSYHICDCEGYTRVQ